jgi:hypothetical protein
MSAIDVAITWAVSTSLRSIGIDDRQDVTRRQTDPFQRLLSLIGREIERLQVLGEPCDGLQWRAQFVTQRGDELRLREVGALGSMTCELG